MEIMKRTILGIMCLLFMSLTCQAQDVNGTQINLQAGYINPGGLGNQDPKSPLPSLTIGQDDHTLYMSNVGFDCVLRIIDDDDNVVYSTYVAASTNTVVLPSTLSGSYKIEFLTSDYYFWGYIDL